MVSDNRKIGTGLLVLGFVFLFLGVMMFFDSGLLAIGDILIVTGITLTIGPQRTVGFFRRKPLRANAFFFGGIMLVIARWAVVGMVLQSLGFLNLFGPFIPIAVDAMRTTPILGDFLNLPGVTQVVDKIAGRSRRGQRAPV